MSTAVVERCTDTKILACRGCLATLSADIVLHDLNKNDYAQCFSDFIGFSVDQSDGYPQFVCSTCLFLLRKFVRFRRKCLTAMQTLQQLKLSVDIITTDSIKSIDTTNIKHNYQKQNVIDINIINHNEDRNPFGECHSKLDDIHEYDMREDEIIKTEKWSTVKSPKEVQALTEHVGTNSTTDEPEYIDIEVSLPPYNENDDFERIKATIKEESKTPKKKTVKKVKQENYDSDDSPTLYNLKNDNDFDRIKTTYSIKVESTPKKKPVKRVKQEHSDTDDSLNNADDFKSKKPNRKEESNTPKKKVVKKTVKNIKPIKDKPNIRKRVRKVVDKEEAALNEDWTKIIEEIKQEIATNSPTKRKVPSKAYLKSIIKHAKTNATSNNMDLKFLTKEEQKIEIEEKRSSEKFKKAPYKCDKCCKVFRNKLTFANHNLLHSGGEFECEICLYRFQTRRQHQDHFTNRHLKKITCKECGQSSRNWNEARQHYLLHRGKHLNITCEQCGLRFAFRKYYLNHVQNKHGGRVNGPQCLLCDRAFYSDRGLRLHLTKMHQDKLRCSSCDVVFASADALGVHVNAAPGCQPGHSCCPICGNNFTDESEMKTHYNDKHTQNYYKCDQCKKTFKDVTKYTTHLNHHTRTSIVSGEDRSNGDSLVKPNEEKKRVVCEICGQEKQCMALLLEHQRLHTGETPHKCDYCPKTFRLKQALQNHIATHTDERRYKCKICPKAFKQAAHRTIHMASHSKDRPYACTSCPKRYPYAASLREHVNTAHLGLPPRKRVKKD